MIPLISRRLGHWPPNTEASLPETTSNFPESGALVLAANKTSSEGCGNLFAEPGGEMPSARRQRRNAGQEIRSAVGRGEEADKAAKKAASVTKTGFGGKVRRARMFTIQSLYAAKSWHTPRAL